MRKFDSFIPDLHKKIWIVAAFLVVIGLDVLLAPEFLVVTPAHQLAFDYIGRGPIGAWMVGTGLAVGYTAYKSKYVVTLWFAAMVTLFWFIVTFLPAVFGAGGVFLLGIELGGQINTISTLAWGYITYGILSLYREARYGPVVDRSFKTVIGRR